MELFPEFEKEMQSPVAPLADRMRPEDWEKFAGQEHLVGEGLPLRELVESGSRLSFYYGDHRVPVRQPLPGFRPG